MTHLEKCYQEHKKKEKIIECTISITATAATGVDTGCFQHRIGIPIDFGHTNLGIPKSNL